MGDGLGDFAFWGAIGVIGLALLNGPIGRAVAARLQGRKSAPPDEGRVRELEARVADWSNPRPGWPKLKSGWTSTSGCWPASETRRGSEREANEGRLGQGRRCAVHGHRRADALDLRAATVGEGLGAQARRPCRSHGRRNRRGAGRPPARVGELADLQARMAELEERLEFAERLLATRREADQLPGGR
jgi:hypothetical protein